MQGGIAGGSRGESLLSDLPFLPNITVPLYCPGTKPTGRRSNFSQSRSYPPKSHQGSSSLQSNRFQTKNKKKHVRAEEAGGSGIVTDDYMDDDHDGANDTREDEEDEDDDDNDDGDHDDDSEGLRPM